MRALVALLALSGSPWLAIADDLAKPLSSSGVTEIECRCSRSGRWFIQETTNFRVCSLLTEQQTGDLARLCEKWRAAHAAKWLGDDAPGSWLPRCEIVVWRTVDEYGQALGRPGDRSVGCATCQIDGERIVSRRIDLRGDAPDWWRSALPHELTHVVLADRFAGRLLPPWADEGIAVLAEPEFKRAQRAAALSKARQSGLIYRVDELLNLRTPPEPARRDAFYGQSAELVELLASRGSSADLIRFLETSHLSGYHSALQSVYGIGGVVELARLYEDDVALREPMQTVVVASE